MKSHIQSILLSSLLLFSILGILFIPFPFNLFPYQESISQFVFGDLIESIKPFYFTSTEYKEISSDSSSLYLLTLILTVVSIFGGLVISFFNENRRFRAHLKNIIFPIIYCYLSLQLLKYGYDKVSLRQFYTPDPNTLFTPLGNLDKDILFWSTVGASKLFNILLGAAEMIAGTLLLFRKTRFFGLIFSTLIFLSVVCINFSFDISVKIYASFLLITSLVGLSHYQKLFVQLWFEIKKVTWRKTQFHKYTFRYTTVKTFVIILFVIELFLPDIRSTIFLSDYQKPIPDGAYSVLESNMNSDIKNVFFHRSNYIIFQNHKDQMADYSYEVNQLKKEITLSDYDLKKKNIQFDYDNKDSTIYLENPNDDTYLLAKMIDLSALPIFTEQFHWSVDGGMK